MAVANQTIQDSRYRTIIKTLSTGTTSAGEIVDCSGLVGFQTGGLLTIAKVSWSLSSEANILWDATSNVIALSLNGNGTYGFMPGQPALPNNAASANRTGDVLFTAGAACIGYVVVEYHKAPTAEGVGWSDGLNLA
ncbi:MAG: hypothetical protein VX199_05970 [Chloroflexota bacterium]|nr:hypothetical protein [Chloroflexota bacterium]